MKPVANPVSRKKAFTIVELLTVMSIIVILIGLLIPALNKVKQYATNVKQSAQFHSIDAALELFSNEFEGYPESGALDPTGAQYCGAMKLCEALMGQDLLGVHSSTVFRADGLDASGDTNNPLYPQDIDAMGQAARDSNLKARKGPYLQPENANAYRMEDIYASTGSFLTENFVLCDVYGRRTANGLKTGMPILYYKANTAYNQHKANLYNAMTESENNGNIYNYLDNDQLLALGKPWDASATTDHKLYAGGNEPTRFYKNTQSDKIVTASRPFNADKFILISAGYDGEYGTADDICNYEWKYVE